jgi:hypothetical protein
MDLFVLVGLQIGSRDTIGYDYDSSNLIAKDQ